MPQSVFSNIKTTEIHAACHTLDNLRRVLTTVLLVYQQREKKKHRQKTKGFALTLAPNFFTNKYVYFAKSQILLISEMLKMKLSLKFGKIMRNRLRNLAVSFTNHNKNYNASGNIVNENVLSLLFLNIDRNKSRSSGHWIYVRKSVKLLIRTEQLRLTELN